MDKKINIVFKRYICEMVLLQYVNYYVLIKKEMYAYTYSLKIKERFKKNDETRRSC